MEDSAMKKDVGDQLPKKILFPNQNGDECKVVIKIINIGFDFADFNYFLKEKDSNHDDHQFFNNGCQTIPERETVAVIAHFNPSSLNPPSPPFRKGGRGGI
jgi:hypothetical protein